MNEQVSGPHPHTISAQHMEVFLREIAERFSELRKIHSLLEIHRQRLRLVRELPSTQAEMTDDWNKAKAFLCLKILEGDDVGFTQLEPQTYAMLEEVWVEEVVQLKAYYNWEQQVEGSAEENYFKASNDIREILNRASCSDLLLRDNPQLHRQQLFEERYSDFFHQRKHH